MINIPTSNDLDEFILRASFKLKEDFELDVENTSTGFSTTIAVETGVYTWEEFSIELATRLLLGAGINTAVIGPEEGTFLLGIEVASFSDDLRINLGSSDTNVGEHFTVISGDSVDINAGEEVYIPLQVNTGHIIIKGDNVRYLQDWRIFQEGVYFEGLKGGGGNVLYNTRGRMFFRYMYANELSRRQAEYLLFNGQGHGAKLHINEDVYDVSFAVVEDTEFIIDDLSLGGRQAINLELLPRKEEED